MEGTRDRDACEIAVTETEAGLGTAVGARYKASFAVPRIVVETMPLVEFPPLTPFTCQVTPVLLEPETLAVNDCVASVAMVMTLGEMVTLTCASEEASPANARMRIAAPLRLALLRFGFLPQLHEEAGGAVQHAAVFSIIVQWPLF